MKHHLDTGGDELGGFKRSALTGSTSGGLRETSGVSGLAQERYAIEGYPNLDDQGRDEQLATLEQTVANFGAVFDRDRYAGLVTRGKRRLSHQAFLAALLVNLYRDEPIFQLPFRLLTALIDIDEGFTAWRYRHALLAHRMTGGRIGTGGTAGHVYLEAAARKHRVFRDLFDLPTFFVPRSALPTLPPEIAEQMGFPTEESAEIPAAGSSRGGLRRRPASRVEIVPRAALGRTPDGADRDVAATPPAVTQETRTTCTARAREGRPQAGIGHCRPEAVFTAR